MMNLKKVIFIFPVLISFCFSSCSNAGKYFDNELLNDSTYGRIYADYDSYFNYHYEYEEVTDLIAPLSQVRYKEANVNKIKISDYELIIGFTDIPSESTTFYGHIYPNYPDYIFCLKSNGNVTLVTVSDSGNNIYKSASSIAYEEYKNLITETAYGQFVFSHKSAEFYGPCILALHNKYVENDEGYLCYQDDKTVVNKEKHYIPLSDFEG